MILFIKVILLARLHVHDTTYTRYVNGDNSLSVSVDQLMCHQDTGDEEGEFN